MMDVMLIRKELLDNNRLSVLNGTVNLSHFLPCMEHGYKAERAFISSITLPNIERPFAYISVLPETGEVLFYKHCAIEDFMDTNCYPLDMVIDSSFDRERSVDEQIQLERELLSVYSEVREFTFNDNLDEQQKAFLIRFNELFTLVVPKGLLPFYIELSPGFFSWMEKFI